jgi:Mg/Co/Ni transporter MgtE
LISASASSSPNWNVGQAIGYMRETSDLPERFYELYVVDEASHFLGAVALDRMLRSMRVLIEHTGHKIMRCGACMALVLRPAPD